MLYSPRILLSNPFIVVITSRILVSNSVPSFSNLLVMQEKLRGRNKLVPRLLGITRESIMRVDENTKEVLKTWPLTTVRRWAASPNSFTLVTSPSPALAT